MKRPPITQAMNLAFAKEWGAFPCVDCQRAGHYDLYGWEHIQRDHDLALIDGGKHLAKALVPRCIPHHKIKSAHEHRENCRAKRRKAKHEGTKKSKTPFPKPSPAVKARKREREREMRAKLKMAREQRT